MTLCAHGHFLVRYKIISLLDVNFLGLSLSGGLEDKLKHFLEMSRLSSEAGNDNTTDKYFRRQLLKKLLKKKGICMLIKNTIMQ